jgi:uncharacterized RDD family membrane protein YckC
VSGDDAAGVGLASGLDPASLNVGAGTVPSSLRRRLACMVYEGVLLFGVLMIFGTLYSSLTGQRHALVGRHGLQAFVFVVLAIYFAWFWSHGGQTVAMKAWHVRLVSRSGNAVSEWRATARYVLSWLWFVPSLVLASIAGWHGSAIFVALATGAAAYAGLVLIRPDRQFLHDALCGTQLVDARSAAGKAASPLKV